MTARYVPPAPFVAVPYKRPTGQSGMLRLLPSQIAAVGEIGPQNCSVLFIGSSDWLTVNLSADEFFTTVGIDWRAEEPQP